MMKFIWLLLAVSAVSAAPSKKRFIDLLGIDITNILDLDTLKCDVQILLDFLGNDPVEEACETECTNLLTEGTTFVYGCPLICHGLQDFANYFHEEPKPGEENLPCGGDAIRKRTT